MAERARAAGVWVLAPRCLSYPAHATHRIDGSEVDGFQELSQTAPVSMHCNFGDSSWGHLDATAIKARPSRIQVLNRHPIRPKTSLRFNSNHLVQRPSLSLRSLVAGRPRFILFSRKLNNSTLEILISPTKSINMQFSIVAVVATLLAVTYAAPTGK